MAILAMTLHGQDARATPPVLVGTSGAGPRPNAVRPYSSWSGNSDSGVAQTYAILLTACGMIRAGAGSRCLFLLVFGVMGAGELGTVYFDNHAISVTPAASGAQTLALLNLATALSGVATVFYGIQADKLEFYASFVFGIAAGGLALALVRRLPAESSAVNTQSSG